MAEIIRTAAMSNRARAIWSTFTFERCGKSYAGLEILTFLQNDIKVKNIMVNESATKRGAPGPKRLKPRALTANARIGINDMFNPNTKNSRSVSSTSSLPGKKAVVREYPGRTRITGAATIGNPKSTPMAPTRSRRPVIITYRGRL